MLLAHRNGVSMSSTGAEEREGVVEMGGWQNRGRVWGDGIEVVRDML